MSTVVFLCVHNAGRSQMALGWFRHLAGDRHAALARGDEPANRVNAGSAQAMAEVGIDITGEVPARWTPEELEGVDVVVSMGCGDAVPHVPGARMVEWAVPDPAGQTIERVRPIRDEIERLVRALLDELTPAPPAAPGPGSAWPDFATFERAREAITGGSRVTFDDAVPVALLAADVEAAWRRDGSASYVLRLDASGVTLETVAGAS